MKSYNSMYLGICVNNDDPEKRGRVQIFIPHLMPALYENWNEKGEDIKIVCVGDNMIQGLTSDILEKLKKILPWAEAASPILGTSAPGNLISGAAGAGGIAGGNYYDQSPNSSPVVGGGTLSVPGVGQISGSNGSVIQAQGSEAAVRRLPLNQNLVSTLERGLQGTGLNFRVTSGGQAPIGSGGARTGSTRHDNGNAADGDFVDAATGRVLNPATNAQDRARISGALGQLRSAGIQGVGWDSSGYMGPTRFHLDIVSPGVWGANGRGVNGHQWVRDALTRGGSGGFERTSVSGDTPSAPVHALATPKNLTEAAPPNQYGNATNQYHTESSGSLSYPTSISSGNTQLRNFSGNNSQAYATVRAAAAAAGSPDPDTTAAIAMFESGHLGSSMSQRANNPFGQTITRSQIGTNGIVGGTTGADGQLHAVYDSLESAVSHHLSRWGNRYVAGNIAATTNNMIAGGYNSEVKGGLAPGQYWQNGVLNRYNALSGQTASPVTGLAGAPPTGQTPGDMAQNLGLSTNIINNTDKHGPAASQNLNGVAKGLFTYPAAGAMLWTFFREGNPLFPVYFACSYSQAEWQSAYRNVGNPATGAVDAAGPGYNPTPKNGEPQSTGGIMNLNGVGGIRWEDTNNLADRTQDQKSIMFFGEDGSNLFFGRGYNQILSKFDRRDQVEGDRWETTLGYKEQWVQGDYNRVVMGDQYIKVGNVGPEAVKAVDNIIAKIKEIQAPLSETTA